MAGFDVKLNHSGVSAILKSSEVAAMVTAAAEEIADNVRAQGIVVGAFSGGDGDIELPVEVTPHTTDRARASVTLAHPAGIAVQAKHGALTKAASAAGVEVNAVLYYTTKSGVTRRATQAQIDNWTRGKG
jgi:hypothetical protein